MTIKQYPFYFKSTVIFFGIVLVCVILSSLRAIFIPLAFGLILAWLLNPLSNKLMAWRLKKVWSIIVSIIMAIIAIILVSYFLISKASIFSEELPLLHQKLHELLAQCKDLMISHFGISSTRVDQMFLNFQDSINPLLGQMVGTVLGTIAVLVLTPVYTFLFMYYKTLLLNFLYETFEETNSIEVSHVLSQSKGAIQSYMFGILLETSVVAVLNVSALFLLGVEYALLLGIMGAMLNILPYIGGILSVALPLVIATITKDGFHTQFGIIVCYLVIQFTDNHLFVPYFVSSKVRITALISIVIVLLGGALWGVPGMFLSIPFIGVIKIVFDRIPNLKPWGKLLGDEVPVKHKGEVWLFKPKRAKLNANNLHI